MKLGQPAMMALMAAAVTSKKRGGVGTVGHSRRGEVERNVSGRGNSGSRGLAGLDIVEREASERWEKELTSGARLMVREREGGGEVGRR